jgi:hypothetical protein
MTAVLQHSKDEFRPKRPTQKIDHQHINWRMANSKLADILASDDPFWITCQVRGYLGLLEAAHLMGTAGSLLTNAAVTVQIVLTDGEHIHDRRSIHPRDLANLNEAAKAETDGEMWWEMRPFDAEANR